MTNSIIDDFKNAWHKPDNAPAQLIIINVIVYLFLGVLFVVCRIGDAEGVFTLVHNQFSIPPAFGEFLTRPWTLITYSFAHSLSGIFHILFNMLVFYWFSRLIVEYVGNQKVISLYVLGALAGGTAYLIVYNTIPYYIQTVDGFPGMVGASAAVYATVVAAATLIPNYTFYLLFLGPIKIKYIAAFYIVISFLGSVGSNAGGNVAHLGGAFIGYFYIRQLQAGWDMGAWVIKLVNFFRSFFVKKPTIKVSHKKRTVKTSRTHSSGSTGSTKSKTGHATQEEIDAILDKISRSGYESLSKTEKQKLFNASKK